jgi:hypothetical protein
METNLTKEQEKELKKKLRFVNNHIGKLKFTDIPLVRVIIHHNAEIMLIRHKEKKELTQEQTYVMKLNDSITAFMENFRDIELIDIFLQERLKNKTISRKGITDPEYIRYHMENYFIRMHKIKDQTCILLNNYFNLKYSEKYRLEQNLLNDEFLKSTSLTMYIKYCNESFSKLRPVRNEIAHQSGLKTSDLGMLESILLSKRISQKMRRTYMYKKEAQIRVFTFLSKKNRKIFYEAIISMLIILNQGFIPEYEKQSGNKIADEIAYMMKQKPSQKV